MRFLFYENTNDEDKKKQKNFSVEFLQHVIKMNCTKREKQIFILNNNYIHFKSNNLFE